MRKPFPAQAGFGVLLEQPLAPGGGWGCLGAPLEDSDTHCHPTAPEFGSHSPGLRHCFTGGQTLIQWHEQLGSPLEAAASLLSGWGRVLLGMWHFSVAFMRTAESQQRHCSKGADTAEGCKGEQQRLSSKPNPPEESRISSLLDEFSEPWTVNPFRKAHIPCPAV